MARIKGGMNAKKKHNRVLKLAKGYRELPECSTMRKSEDKLKYILPYGAKQAIKIKFAGKKNK